YISNGSFTQKWSFDELDTENETHVLNKSFAKGGYHHVILSLLSDKGCKDSLTRLVYLEEDKHSSIDILENDSQCLPGNAFQFSSIKHNPLVQIDNSTWFFGDGEFSQLLNPELKTYEQVGQYEIRLTSISKLGCHDSVSTQIFILPHPSTQFSGDTVCFPEFVSFQNNSTIESGKISSYTWSLGDGAVSNSPSPTHHYKSAGLYDVQLITASEFGCADTLIIENAVAVHKKPHADFTFNSISSDVVNETKLQLENQSKDAINYQWNFGNSNESSETNPIAIYKDTGRYYITLLAISREGCV